MTAKESGLPLDRGLDRIVEMQLTSAGGSRT